MRKEREREGVDEKREKEKLTEGRVNGFKSAIEEGLSSKRHVLKSCVSGSGNFEDGEWEEDGDGGEGDDFFGRGRGRGRGR